MSFVVGIFIDIKVAISHNTIIFDIASFLIEE
jgi:hypothetical protein